MTHYDRILDYIERFGSITTMEAFMDLGETKLTSRISDLRRKYGVEFDVTEEKSRNRFGQTVRYNRYTLAKQNKAGSVIV